MTQPTLMITPDGKHPAQKWAMLAADEIVNITAQAESTLMREAMDFKNRLVHVLTQHHQVMMDHEQEQINAGNHALDLPYETEAYAATVRDEICNSLAKGTSFAEHFQKSNVRTWVEGICDKYFKSAKVVERQHFHSEKAAAPINKKKK